MRQYTLSYLPKSEANTRIPNAVVATQSSSIAGSPTNPLLMLTVLLLLKILQPPANKIAGYQY